MNTTSISTSTISSLKRAAEEGLEETPLKKPSLNPIPTSICSEALEKSAERPSSPSRRTANNLTEINALISEQIQNWIEERNDDALSTYLDELESRHLDIQNIFTNTIESNRPKSPSQKESINTRDNVTKNIRGVAAHKYFSKSTQSGCTEHSEGRQPSSAVDD